MPAPHESIDLTDDTARASAPHAAAGMSHASIMLIDDEEITVEVLQMFLEEAGYQHFIPCIDSREAFLTIERERPDIVLLDLMMPNVDGFEILAHIRADERFEYLPVVILTSSTDAQTKLRALEMGATDFLAKPVDQSELVLRVRNTLAAKAYQDRLAYVDRLTGLPNRHMMLDRLEWAIEHAKRYDQTGALLHIDVSRFRHLNDMLGPAKADMLLQQIADRLDEVSRTSDLLSSRTGGKMSSSLARLGGDEFSLLLLGHFKPTAVARIAKRILSLINEPFDIDGQELFASLCIGIALFPQDGDDLDTIQRNAAIAVRSLQGNDTNAHGAFQFYADELNTRSHHRLNLETELRRALDRDEFELFYQPQYSIAGDSIVGIEALLRWKHPDRGYVSPIEFIPVAEELGLIFDLGQRVLTRACHQMRLWEEAGMEPGCMSVNVSVQQFRHPSFVESVRGALAYSGIAPERLKLEITESLLAVNVEQTALMLGRLREIGVKMSIDDFGTGYSSLSYLRSLPIDELKIDRSFLADVETSADSAAIVRAILALAHSLDMSVTAEGVETPGQLTFLHAHNCDAFQGFLYSKPLPISELERLLPKTQPPLRLSNS